MHQRVFTVGTFYGHVRMAMASVGAIVRARRSFGGNFSSQLMLAVTQVNGCRLCSWFHTSVALKEGASEGQLQDLIDGDLGHLDDRQAACVLFAQHYADRGGHDVGAALAHLEREVGPIDAGHALALTKAIMVGNIHGISFDAIRLRLRGEPLTGSGIGHEVGIALGGALLPFLAAAHNLLAGGPALAPAPA